MTFEVPTAVLKNIAHGAHFCRLCPASVPATKVEKDGSLQAHWQELLTSVPFRTSEQHEKARRRSDTNPNGAPQVSSSVSVALLVSTSIGCHWISSIGFRGRAYFMKISNYSFCEETRWRFRDLVFTYSMA